MLQSHIDQRQLRLCEDRSSSFRGTACVELEQLSFDKPSSDCGLSNITRLEGIFRTEGCFPVLPENRIVATINQEILEEVLRTSAITQRILLENPDGVPPLLKFPPAHQVSCLKGRSRVEAAKKVLLPGKRTWAVDLYLEGI